MWMLIAIAGPDKGQAHPLDPAATREQPMVLGREGDPFRLSDRRASRRHAGLFREGGRWYVEDLGSTTGTLRNHKPLEETEPLREGDFLQVGKTVLTLSRMEAPTLGPHAAATPPAEPRRAPLAGGATRGTGAWILGTGSAAAVVLVGLGLLNQHQATRLAQEVRVAEAARAAAEAEASDRAEAFEQRLLKRLEEERRRGEAAVAALAPAQAETAEALTALRASVDTGAGELAGLAAGLGERDRDAAAALADATARRLRDTVQPLTPEAAERLAAAAERAERGGEAVAEQVAAVREIVAALPEAMTPAVEALAASVETASAASRDDVLAAVEELRTTLPGADDFNSRMARVEAKIDRLPDAAALDARLASIVEVLEQPPGGDADDPRFEALQSALASIAADLKERPDAAALRGQLEAVAAGRPVAPDPLLAQVLAGLAEQRAATEGVQVELARLRDRAAAPAYDADELARSIVAALPEPQKAAAVTGQPATAVAIDERVLASAVETALSGTAIGDAGGLRDLVRVEVSMALESAARGDEPTADGQIDRGQLERAYRRAFDTGRRDVLPGGRVLDPATARAAGIKTWRDWFLIEEFAERMRLAREASRIRGTLADPTVVNLPSR
ncbi:FHA domain-containing protein [Phycisphaera mikurensis]|uniref:FHA domain-containing protein n=1 Tax=Phycisphaera mikurensis (strain NBRC 102666 / KCTC 22515 / FYK2301M01) TaxID=1142394 RepID=I0IEZ6_PHYMF|nr:FHA domain-containing protein [Phycisphaera mikurensis]MBB6441628.1 hypothetical protein [Phycisphaera mikurensis]BAM03834.1 hypothetical protein PSMK_16750 [Phycisphaera mikurensis NBRC 102666]